MVVSRAVTDQDVKAKLALETLCPIGEPMSLEWKGTKYQTIFRGAKRHTYVLSHSSSGAGKAKYEIAVPGYVMVDIPVVAGKQVLFEFHSTFTLRFLANGVVYGFQSHFERVHPKPSLLVLDYPSQIDKYSLRKHERLATVIPVAVSEFGSPHAEQGAILNLSADGAMVALETPNGHAVGNKVTFTCTLPDGSAIGDLHATIKNLKPSDEKAFLGVNFSEENPGPVQTVRKYYHECYQYLKERAPCLK